jgi:hypothetical protein
VCDPDVLSAVLNLLSISPELCGHRHDLVHDTNWTGDRLASRVFLGQAVKGETPTLGRMETWWSRCGYPLCSGYVSVYIM